jgi:hypothetical protein
MTRCILSALGISSKDGVSLDLCESWMPTCPVAELSPSIPGPEPVSSTCDKRSIKITRYERWALHALFRSLAPLLRKCAPLKWWGCSVVRWLSLRHSALVFSRVQGARPAKSSACGVVRSTRTSRDPCHPLFTPATLCRYIADLLEHPPRTSLSDLLSSARSTKARLLHYCPPSTCTADSTQACADDWCGWHTDHGALTGKARWYAWWLW